MKAEWNLINDDENLTCWRLVIVSGDRSKIIGSVYDEKWNPRHKGFSVYLAYGKIAQRIYPTRQEAQTAVEVAALEVMASEVAALTDLMTITHPVKVVPSQKTNLRMKRSPFPLPPKRRRK